MRELIRRGHHIGGGMLDPGSGTFVLNIPKNASSYVSNILYFNKWEHWNLCESYKINRVAILLRNPLDRWVSGFTTYVCSYLLGPNRNSEQFITQYNSLIEDLIFDNLIFDDHTTPQVTFIKEIPPHLEIFYIRTHRESLINSLSKLSGVNLVDNDQLFNNSKELNYDANIINQFIKSRLTPELEKKIQGIYRDDYQLYNTVKFYD